MTARERRVVYNEIEPFAAAWLGNLERDGHIAAGDVDTRSIRDLKGADLAGYSQVHLFAGIGGWSYALRLAGWDDSRSVWTGSCPCQPYSAAGKRKGQDDPRDLWPDMYRLIRECRPDCIFGEQVESAIGHGWLDRVFGDLEAEGYACGAAVLGAHSVGAPHIRQRLFWVAVSEGKQHDGRRDARGGRGELANGRGMCHTDARRLQKRTQRNGESIEGSADRDSCGPDAHGSSDRLEHPTRDGRDERRAESSGRGAAARCESGGMADADRTRSGRNPGELSTSQTGVDSPRLQDGSDPHRPWDGCVLIPCADGKARRVKSEIQPLACGVPNRVGTLRGAGNAIVPQAAAAFVTAFMEANP